MASSTTNGAASGAASGSAIVATLTGCVKWFNNSRNYGFITVLSDGEYRNTDVFVHQSNIQTARDCFRTLHTGECVQFDLAKSDNEQHPFHAVGVHGFNGVQLRCEVPRNRGFGGGARGRGGFRGASSYRGQRDNHHGARSGNRQESQNVVESTPQAASDAPAATASATAPATAPASATTNASASASASAPASVETGAKGRSGRGRGRKVNA